MLCLVFKLNIAQVYFNNRYDNFNNGDASASLNIYNNQYLTTGVAINTMVYGFSWGLNLKTYSLLSGVETNSRTYFKQGNNYQPTFSKNTLMPNTDFIVGGSRFYHTDTSLVFLWRFNSNLDSVKYAEYGYLNKTNYISAIEKQDVYIYMAGSVDSLYQNTDILLIKTDTSGNEIWKKKIGLPNYDETAYCIKQCANGNLLIGGLKQLHGTSTQGPFVMRMDTSGAILWQNFYPSATYANGSFDVMELPNGDIVFTGGKAYNITAQGTMRRPMLTRVDAGGNLIWQKEYGEKAFGHDFFTFLINEKNNFVISGEKFHPDNSAYGMVYEINQNGDSLFCREYAVQPGSQNYFRDLVQAPDKGYVFSGFITPLFANGGTGNQDIWLLKTDSTFCEGAFNCGYPTSISEAECSLSPSKCEAGVKISPNPVKDVLNIDISTTLDVTKELIVKITDVLGKELLFTDYQTQINISHFETGIYFVSIMQGDKTLVTKKVVKQ